MHVAIGLASAVMLGCITQIVILGYTLFWFTLDILLTVSNFATTCQLAVIRVLVDCLLNIF